MAIACLKLMRAIRAQLDKVAHSTMLGLASEPAVLLGERLMRIVPRSLKKVFYSDSGATATEIAFKLAAQYWFNIGRKEKCEFVGFSDGYHGDTVGAMSVGRMPAFHAPYFPMLFPAHFCPSPYVYRSDTPTNSSAVAQKCLDALEQLLDSNGRRIAAVCIEPTVQGAGGIIVHPEGFLREVRRITTAHDVLLIADEVATGFGRTGRMFACEHEAVEPDLMCTAKGISGGYLPLAATFASQRIFDAFLGEPWEGKSFFHGHTYTGNPLACAAALASLDLFEKNQLVARVTDSSLPRLLEPLRELPTVGEVRQKGFMVGIELVADRTTRQPFDPRKRIGAVICARLRKRGVIIRPLADVLVLMPPLAISETQLQTLVNAVFAEISDVSREQ